MARIVLTAALAAALALGGCGGDEPEPPETPPTLTAPEATTQSGGSTTTQPDPDAPAENDEGTGGSQPAPAASAEDAIRAVLTTEGDAEQACTAFVTEEFVATAYGGRANCVAARRPSALAGSLRISDEGGGTYTVIPSGGPYDGVEVEVEVVESDGYRVSSLVADVPPGP